MKRKVLMTSTAMLLSLAAIAGGDTTKVKSCCKGSACVKTCSKKCTCNTKCTPQTCTSKNCTCTAK